MTVSDEQVEAAARAIAEVSSRAGTLRQWETYARAALTAAGSIGSEAQVSGEGEGFRPISDSDLEYERRSPDFCRNETKQSIIARLDAVQEALDKAVGLWMGSITKNAEKRCDLICAQQEEGTQSNV